MPLGTELRDARERAGLSIEQIAARTGFELHEIAALEHDSLTDLPDEAYLEGLILSYAAEVGLNGASVMDRVRIERKRYERDWEARREFPDVFDDTLPQKAPEESPHHRDEPPQPPEEQLHQRHEELDQPEEELQLSEEQLHQPQAVIDLESIDKRQPGPPDRLRRERLLLPLLSVLAVTGWAAYFLESGAFERQTTVSASSATVQPAHPGGGVAGPARVMTEEAVKPAIPAPAAVPSVDTAAPIANDVSGRWKLETKVGSTRLRRFVGLQLGYQIDLNQKGGRVTGTGKKISENGKTLAARAQTPIRLAGKITDNKLILSFTEGGRRVSRGGFAMQLDESGALRGRFSSNAARSSGTAEAHRQP